MLLGQTLLNPNPISRITIREIVLDEYGLKIKIGLA
jgi:hypothetical protein